MKICTYEQARLRGIRPWAWHLCRILGPHVSAALLFLLTLLLYPVALLWFGLENAGEITRDTFDGPRRFWREIGDKSSGGRDA